VGNDSILRNRQFISVFLIAFLVYFSNSMLAQTLPKFAYDLGATSQSIGFLSGVFGICALLLRPVSGQLVDNENRRMLLRVTLGIILVAVTALTFSKQVWLLVVCRGLNGFGWGIGSTLCMTIATGCFSKDKLGTGIGIYGLGQTVALATAPMVGLTVARLYGYNFLYRFNVLICVVAFFLTYFVSLDPRQRPERNYSVSLSSMICVPALTPAFVTLCNMVARSAITAFLVIFAHSISVSQIGTFFTVQALTVLVTRPLWGKLTDRFGGLRIIVPCEIMIAAGLVIIGGAHQLWHFLLAAFLLGAGTAGDQPVLMSECIRRAPEDQRGRASNTSYLGVDIGGFVGANIAGFVVPLVGYRIMYLIFVAPVVLATVTYVLYDWKMKHRDVVSPSVNA